MLQQCIMAQFMGGIQVSLMFARNARHCEVNATNDKNLLITMVMHQLICMLQGVDCI